MEVNKEMVVTLIQEMDKTLIELEETRKEEKEKDRPEFDALRYVINFK